MRNPLTDDARWTVSGKPFHGDPGHSCYRSDGSIVCPVAKVMLADGPGWRELERQERLPLTRGPWTTNEDGLTMSGASICATCDGGGCRDCIG